MFNQFEGLFVNSTAIRLVGYQAETNVLRVVFRSGFGYDYQNVPREVFESLIAAESVGQQFQAIRNTFLYNRLSNAQAQDFLCSAIAASSDQRLMIAA